MTEISKYAPGQFSWVDLMAKDAGAAAEFYTGLFGWETVDNPTDQGGVYTQFTQRGKNVAGMGEMSDEMRQSGMPAVWNSYVTVDNADAVAKRVAELGGAVTMPVMQVMDAGRMAIFADPEGAVFSIWEAGEHLGAEIVNEPNSLVWNELSTRDESVGKQFYQQLFGWDFETDDSGGRPYTEIKLGGRANGGILTMDDTFPAEIPPHWAVYFAVADCQASADRVKSLGGAVHVEPIEIPAGTFAVCADPQGATFVVMRVENPD